MKSIVRLVFAGALLLAAPFAHAQEILVSAAASLKDVLEEIAPLCVKETGVTMKLNLAASGLLARQITAGAPGDLFISADEATMDELDKAGELAPGTRAILAANVLVFVAPADSALKLAGPADLAQASVRRIAIGAPATVPAGRYAQAYLEQAKVWEMVKDKMIPLDNVRTVLSAVAGGNADVGAVYRTDAATEPRVRVAWAVPAGQGPDVRYPVAVLKDAREPAAAAKARAYLLGAAAQKIFARHGFLPPPAAAAPALTPASPAAPAPLTAPAAASVPAASAR